MTDETKWKAVTVNLGGAGPLRNKYRDGAVKWAHEVLDGTRGPYDIVFAQEIHGDEWLKLWTDRGYQAIEGAHKKYRARSALLLREGLFGDSLPFASSKYHGSYVAAATARHPALGDVVLMSVHASPNEVSSTWAQTWGECAGDLPPTRADGYRLWDSDLVLESVRRIAERPQPVIAAGDWNEARAWDDDKLGTSGGEAFFRRVSDVDLSDVCCPGGHEGDPTHVPEQRGRELHIDHVVTSPGASMFVTVESSPRPLAAWPADHRPVEFTIGATDV